VNRSIETTLRTFVQDNPKNWAKYLQSVTFTLNASRHTSTQESPFFLVYGRLPVLPTEIQFDPLVYTNSNAEDFLIELHNARSRAKFNSLMSQEERRDKHDRFRVKDSYNEGMFVMLKYPDLSDKTTSRKLAPNFRGPFKIIKRITPLKMEILELDGIGRTQIVHVDRLKPIQIRPKELETLETQPNTIFPSTDNLVELRRSERIKIKNK
jgi:hypothetical protein